MIMIAIVTFLWTVFHSGLKSFAILRSFRQQNVKITLARAAEAKLFLDKLFAEEI